MDDLTRQRNAASEIELSRPDQWLSHIAPQFILEPALILKVRQGKGAAQSSSANANAKSGAAIAGNCAVCPEGEASNACSCTKSCDRRTSVIFLKI